MKHKKRILAIATSVVLVLTMMLSIVGTSALEVNSNQGGSATVTVLGTEKNRLYKIVKLFDATLRDDGSAVRYYGDIPSALSNIFEKKQNTIMIKGWNKNMVDENNVTIYEYTQDQLTAMRDWANSQPATASAVADGSTLKFTNLQYGFYIVTTTNGSAVSADTTNPNAYIYDKVPNYPTLTKSVDDDNVYIGQTVTYTLKSTTVNYVNNPDSATAQTTTQTGKTAKKVIKYQITDTLPSYLSNVQVTSITVNGTAITLDPNNADHVFGDDKKIVIDWTDSNGKHLYDTSSELVVTYTATVTGQATIDGDGNKNTATLTPLVTDIPNDDTPPNNPEPYEKSWSDNAVIYTYATAIQKVDDEGTKLAGAKFKVDGLQVTGSNGNYTVTSFDASSTVPGTEMETDAEGKLIIKGVPSDVTLHMLETYAPSGFNILENKINLPVQVIGKEVTSSTYTQYFNAAGVQVDTVTSNSKVFVTYTEELVAKALEIVNERGPLLPATGGIGTAIFYILGGALVLGSAIVLIVRLRMKSKENN